jgi:hypothetical protein
VDTFLFDVPCIFPNNPPRSSGNNFHHLQIPKDTSKYQNSHSDIPQKLMLRLRIDIDPYNYIHVLMWHTFVVASHLQRKYLPASQKRIHQLSISSSLVPKLSFSAIAQKLDAY